MSITELAEQTQFIVSLALFGLIWTIQLVHYPAFLYIDKERFIEFTKMHSLKITLIVAPLMILELFSATYLAVITRFSIQQSILMVLVGLIWLSTILLSVPYHKRLSQGRDDHLIQMLIRTNWIRTTLWTVKAILLVLFSTNF